MEGQSALDLIGNTPLIPLDRLHPGPGRIWAKVEFLQPGGSVKDRAAKQIILDARESGTLQPNMPVFEMTSGNMGSGLAVVCNVLGHPFTAVMSAGNSPARARMLEELGARVILVPQKDGQPGKVTGADIAVAHEVAEEMARSEAGFFVDQFNNASGTHAHYLTTGPEICNQTGGQLDGFIAGAGTGCTCMGTLAYLKQQSATIRGATVEPEGAEILAGKPISEPRHLLQGIGYGMKLPQWKPELIDTYLAVSSSKAVEFRKLLATREGLHVGYSAAANVCGALRWMREGTWLRPPNVVTILCDTGMKYAQ